MSEEENEELIIVGDEEETEDVSDEDQEEETRLGASDEEDEPDDKKKSRRAENRARRQKRREARDRNQRELEFLRHRNEDLERRFSQVEARVGNTEVSAIDARLSQIEGQIETANDVMAKAMEANKSSDFIEAQSIRDTLRDQASRLKYAKEVYTQRQQQAGTQQQEDTPDPRLVGHAQRWMDENDWWDPNGRDTDSLMVSAIDTALSNEGFDPLSKDYWDELTDRVREQLPHRFDEEGSSSSKKSTTRSKGPTFRSGGQERPLKRNEVYINPERRKAMEDAGVWDDPQLRQKYLRAYANYDREQQSH